MSKNYYGFEKFCELLNDNNILKKATAMGVMVHLQKCIEEIKSNVLADLIELNDSKIDNYLDLKINEIKRQDYLENYGIDKISRWLKEFDVRIEDIIKGRVDSEHFHKMVDGYFEQNFDPGTKEYNTSRAAQNDFLLYFLNYYANELISFLESKKISKVIDNKSKNKNSNKKFNDEYLIRFCESISDERAIKETCFSLLYETEISHFSPYLETEIIENLFHLPNDKKDDYIDYAIDKITKTPYSNINKNILDKWLKKYNVDLSTFPKFSNKELNEVLKTYYSGHTFTSHQEQHFILDIQIDFYCYAAMVEAEKMISFLKTKKSNYKGVDNEKVNKEISDFEKLDTYSKLLILFKELKKIKFEITKEAMHCGSSEAYHEIELKYEGDIDIVNRQILEIFDDLYIQSKNENIYYFDCHSDVYEAHFDSRMDSYLEKIPEAVELDFLKAEVKYFSNPLKNRLLNGEYNYCEFIGNTEKYKISLRRKIDFIETKLERYSLKINIEEDVKHKDVVYGKDVYGAKLELVKDDSVLKKKDSSKKLKWAGGPSQLGFIISNLVQLGYIESPLRKNGEINYTKLAESVKETFEIDTTVNSLTKYLNLDSEKGQETSRKFKANNFNVPHLKSIS